MGRIKHIFILLMLTFLLASCRKQDADIVLMDSFRNSPAYEDFEQTLEKWRLEHPGLTVEEKKQYQGITSLGRLGAEHLPDVFVTDCLTGRLFADEGLVLDISMYADDVGTFTYDDAVYAFPVMSKSYSVVVYDRAAIPFNKEDIAIDGDSIIVLSSMMADESGQRWLEHMVSGDKEVAFTDDFFTERLEKLRQYDSFTPESGSTVDAFINGDCPAILTGSIYALLDKVKEKNPELYKRLEFTAFDNKHVPSGYSNGLFINAKVAEDPEKLELCLDLCRTLSGMEIKREEDETKECLNEYLTSVKTAPIWTQYFSGLFWEVARNKCFSRLATGDKSVREYAAILQDVYEQNYLNLEDYSTKLNQYGR